MDELARRIDADADEAHLAREAGDLLVGDAGHDHVHRAALAVVGVRARLGHAVARDDADLRHGEVGLDAVDEAERPRIERVLLARRRAQEVGGAVEIDRREAAVVAVGGERERLAAVDRRERQHRPPPGVDRDGLRRRRVPPAAPAFPTGTRWPRRSPGVVVGAGAGPCFAPRAGGCPSALAVSQGDERREAQGASETTAERTHPRVARICRPWFAAAQRRT